jgi:probable HAF family extracellular repeat protein
MSVPGLLLMLVTIGSGTDVPKLSFKFHTVNVPGSTQTYPSGINNAGVMVGSYEDTANAFHGYILKGKKITTLDVPRGSNTSVGHLTRKGTIRIVGSYKNSAGRYLGFLYQNGKYMDIPGPKGAIASGANGISDHGEIVGYYTDSSNVTHGFLLRRGHYTTLTVYMAQITIASGVNDHGKLVYWSVNGLTGVTTSYLYDIKTQQSTAINVPGATDSLATDINNLGDVTYQWLDSGGVSHGALLDGGKYYKFDDPKSVSDYAEGINDFGAIVGAYEAVSGGPFLGYPATY